MPTKYTDTPTEQFFQSSSFKQFMELIPGHFFIKDQDGVFLATNRSLTRDGKVEIVGKTDFDMPWKNEATPLLENDKTVMESGQEMTFTEKLRVNGRDLVTYYVVKSPLFDTQGNIVGVIGHATEIKK